uniref:Uncharacterized protein n=1 Tax=Glossina austeni TaxID=7395 RepID=A0A1A9VEU4_GLOAU
MKTVITPEVDMLVVARSSQNQRKAIMNFAPRIGLAVVDYARLDEIDRFYIDCQNFRDYYRDPYYQLHLPIAFKKHYGKCGHRPTDKCIQLFMKPTEWVRERQPVVYPIEYGRELNLDEGIKLGGLYDVTSCIKYKR